MALKPRKTGPKTVRASGDEAIKPNQSKDLGGNPMPQSIDLTDQTDADLVRNTLRAICSDATAPVAAKAQAARTLAEMAGALGRHSAPPTPPSKPVASLTLAELEAELARAAE